MSLIEYIVIGIIVTGAVLYLGAVIFKKVKGMSSDNKCGPDCGCGS